MEFVIWFELIRQIFQNSLCHLSLIYEGNVRRYYRCKFYSLDFEVASIWSVVVFSAEYAGRWASEFSVVWPFILLLELVAMSNSS